MGRSYGRPKYGLVRVEVKHMAVKKRKAAAKRKPAAKKVAKK